MAYLLNGQDMVLGTCYYPEHWDKSMWESDLLRMLDTGISVVRIAEFAWIKSRQKKGNTHTTFLIPFWIWQRRLE